MLVSVQVSRGGGGIVDLFCIATVSHQTGLREAAFLALVLRQVSAVRVAGDHVADVKGAVADADDTTHHSRQQQQGQENSPPVGLGRRNVKHVLDGFNGRS